jgi:formate hydrogenlyase transcriptional activator
MNTENVYYFNSTNDDLRTDRPGLIETGIAEQALDLTAEIGDEPFRGIVGQSRAIQRVLQAIEAVAPTDSTVLLLGETGTGKELIARAIHERSRRGQRAVVKVNCAAIPTGLLESEVFGHERGAFTGAFTQRTGRLEMADNSTLFLDEIGDIPVELQPKLLRALQEREFERLGSTRTRSVDVRVIAATNCDLSAMVAEKKFRSDLYYRLNVFPVNIPPLRERRDDIPLLLRYFVRKYARRLGRDIRTVSGSAMRQLMRWHWPGNIRELENFVERAVILTTGTTLAISHSDFPRSVSVYAAQIPANSDGEDRVIRILGKLFERALMESDTDIRPKIEIETVLKETRGRVSGPRGAATRLGVPASTLESRIRSLNINKHQFRVNTYVPAATPWEKGRHGS